jgi:hypothetical protein
MARPPSHTVLDILYSTLRQFEQATDFRADDPVMGELRGQVLRAIADLESKASGSQIMASDRQAFNCRNRQPSIR